MNSGGCACWPAQEWSARCSWSRSLLLSALLIIEAGLGSRWELPPSFADAFLDASSAVGGANLSSGLTRSLTSAYLSSGIRQNVDEYQYGMTWLMLAMFFWTNPAGTDRGPRGAAPFYGRSGAAAAVDLTGTIACTSRLPEVVRQDYARASLLQRGQIVA